jgi:predicted NAD/FAD-binding protein
MPANVVIAALADNGMLQWITSNNPRWMAVQGGAKTYVDAITSVVPPDNLHLNTDIVSVSSLSHGVKLVEGSGREHIYDHVILA